MSEDLKLSSVVDINRGPSWRSNLKLERLGRVSSLELTIVGTLTLLVVIGFALRVNQLSAIGFAEDEMNKLDAVHQYEQRNFTANAEHPMLMKVLMLISLHALPNSSQETALRLPNAIVGALTVVPIFLLMAAFFDRWTALLAAAFWAFGINSITHNRIGKEDSLMVFFMLFAFYFFVRAKQTPPSVATKRYRNYLTSSVAFGLMLAAKYFPHYFGLNMLYHHHFHVRRPTAAEPSGKTPGMFFLLIIIVFILANPAVLLPQVWEYLNAYMDERLLSHSGYLFADHLYKNNMSSSPFWGTPIYFYVLFLAIKVPLMIVGGFVVGLVVSIKRFRHLGHAFLLFMFFFWIVPYSLIGAKWLRYTLALMPFLYMIAAIGVVWVINSVSSLFPRWKQARLVFSVIGAVVFVALPAVTAVANGPHYALYTNALAADKRGYYFPHDEFYDDGMREAIKHVCDNAPQGAIIAHEVPAVARYYLGNFGRADLNSQTISSKEFDAKSAAGPVYAIVQRGRTYFENVDELNFVRSHYRKVHEVAIDGAIAAEVFVKD